MTKPETIVEVEESGMAFLLEADTSYLIEQSAPYNAIRKHGINVVEFVKLDSVRVETPRILFIEAKTSSPRKPNAADEGKNTDRFAAYIEELKQKFVCSLQLFVAIHSTRHQDPSWPDRFSALNLGLISILYVVVIKNSEPYWLPPLQDSLKKSLMAFMKVWSIDPAAVLVITEQKARDKGLIR